MRGEDQNNSPYFSSYAIVTPNEVILFVSLDQITADVRNHMDSEGVTLTQGKLTYKEYTSEEMLKVTEEVVKSTTGNILVPFSANAAIFNLVPSDRLIHDNSPIELMKSVKNAVEAAGMVEANKRDSVAVVKYLHWLEKNVDKIDITEMSGNEKLLEFRR